jgi:GDP-L-fucose synthase
MSNVLVTGGTGFLGTTLVRALRARGDAVTALGSRDADLTRPDTIRQVVARPVDLIFHLAAWTQAGDFCLYHPGEQWVINQQINTNVLRYWQEHQPKAKLVAIGTSCSYDPDLPLREEHYLDGTPIESLFTYAHTKRMLLIGLQALAKQYSMRYLCVVPSTLYGPGYHTDGRQMHFIFDLMRKILRGKYYGEPIELWGDGYQRRELVYVDDFVDAMLALNSRVDNDLVNIGAGEEHTIREFAAVIAEKAGYDATRISYDTSRYVGARSKCLEVGKLRALLPDMRMRALDRGIEETLAWMEAHANVLLPKAS